MITALIICLTVIICVVWVTLWVTYMSKHSLPMWLHAECEHKEDTLIPVPTAIGFAPDETKPETVTPEEKEMSDSEYRAQLFKDTASTISALLRGEVDFDDIKQ